MSRPVLIRPDLRYDFGRGHPMSPGRVRHTMSLAEALGVLDGFDLIDADPMDEALLAEVHEADYIAAVKDGQPHPLRGIGTEDNPIVPDMHEIAASVGAASVTAAKAVWEGRTNRAINIAGGLHHALPGATSGFCIYNDPALAIRWLLDNGAERVAYLDVDAHHGDGVEKIFDNDPRVLTISLHQSPINIFPGTGFATETGGPDARGSAINVALPAGTTDAEWLRSFEAVVPEALEAFAPSILVSQHGCDSHVWDPLTELKLTVDGQRESAAMIADLADAYAGGRWVATGGGGYAVIRVVPRAWTHLLGVIAGHPVDPATPLPPEWRAQFGDDAPEAMTDLHGPVEWTSIRDGWDPASRVDQAVLATRRATFPELGLDPELSW